MVTYVNCTTEDPPSPFFSRNTTLSVRKLSPTVFKKLSKIQKNWNLELIHFVLLSQPQLSAQYEPSELQFKVEH